MNDKRIEKLVDFFYSSEDTKEVPMRIMASTGSFGGFDFDKNGLSRLLYILRDSEDLKGDLSIFREEYDN